MGLEGANASDVCPTTNEKRTNRNQTAGEAPRLSRRGNRISIFRDKIRSTPIFFFCLVSTADAAFLVPKTRDESKSAREASTWLPIDLTSKKGATWQDLVRTCSLLVSVFCYWQFMIEDSTVT
jgi:hypothetical protein